MSEQRESVDQYLNNLEPDRKEALTVVRALILEMVPDVEETLKYRMPTYERQGDAICAFASQKQYMSLYMDVELVEKHRSELAGLDVGKSCIRFRKLEVLPLDTVRAILEETVQRGSGL